MRTLSTYESTVNSFYLAFYGRPADPAGLKFWSQQLAAGNGELGTITQAFATSEEAQVRFGADSLGDRIGEIYQQLFNRTIDADGLAYWTDVVEQGNASLADVSIAILNGARDSDATLSAMRQKAVDAFTAQVEAGGSQYAGYASIEAARILVRAVTADATEADLAQLVKSAVSFADTATKTPAVVEAIAVNTTLLALFDTARGKGDPVALAQALADTAKAAAGDPVTLESLLRGGGMDKVLKVMPAAASLKDVVKALADGGLPAAVEVVYPTAPTAPGAPSSSAFKLAFDHVIESELDVKKDNVTNYSQSHVTFKYTGNDLAKGQHVQASVDGGEHWTQLMVQTDPVTKTVTVLGVKLAGQPTSIESIASPNISIQAEAPQNVTTTIILRVVDAENKPVASFTPFKQDIIFDGYVAMPGLNFGSGESKNAFELATPGVITTSKAVYGIETTEEGAYIQYDTSLAPKNIFPGDFSNWSKDKPVLKEGEITTFDVRQVDVAGNTSFIQTVKVVLDTVKPTGTPVITLAEASSGVAQPDTDGGIAGDSGDSDIPSNTTTAPVGFGPSSTTPVTTTPVTTSPNTVNLTISGLEKSTSVGWEYSTDKGASWTFGGHNTEAGTAPLSLAKLTTGPIEVLVRQLDAAGNVSPQSEPYTIERAEPTFIIAYEHGTLFISGTSTDPVLVDLSADTYARGDGAPTSYLTSKFSSAYAAGYAGDVTVAGTVGEMHFAIAGRETSGIKEFVIADTKSHIFSGEPGARIFAANVESLLKLVDKVIVRDTLSIEERDLFDNLAGFDGEAVDATVDTEAPVKPILGLDNDTGLPGDRETTVGDVVIMELEDTGSFQYRTSKDGLWLNGTEITDGTAIVTLGDPGEKYIEVRQFDAAGNQSLVSEFEFLLLAQQQSEQETGTSPDTGDSDSSGSPDSDGGDGGIEVVGTPNDNGPGIP